jgi:hypothetical protein
MQFLNETGLDCHLSRLQLVYTDLLQAMVVVKGSFEIENGGELSPATASWPVLLEDTDTLYGTLESEMVPAKAWCDVAVLGHAYSPNPRAGVTSTLVSLRIGSFERTVRVTGDRAWTPRLDGGLQPSEPVRFTKLPLRNERAYGGSARHAGDISVPYYQNPDGRGYVELKEDAPGALLPNIEEPDAPIRSWKDRPSPAGLAPLSRTSTMRAQRGITADVEGMTCRFDSSAFCFCHPRMSLPAYPGPAPVTLRGASRTGTWSFQLPAFRYWITIELGARRYQLPLTADTIYLVPDENRIAVVARRTFIYQFLPGRIRSVRVTSQPLAGDLPEVTTIRALRAAAREDVPVKIERSEIMALVPDSVVEAHPMMDLLHQLPLCPSG